MLLLKKLMRRSASDPFYEVMIAVREDTICRMEPASDAVGFFNGELVTRMFLEDADAPIYVKGTVEEWFDALYGEPKTETETETDTITQE